MVHCVEIQRCRGAACKFTGGIKNQVVLFTVVASANDRLTSSINSDTFTLPLPHIFADGAYRSPEKTVSFHQMDDENLQFREGGYIDIVLTIGMLLQYVYFSSTKNVYGHRVL